MSTELIINASLPEIRIALLEEGEIQDMIIERPSGKGTVGNVYKGRVTRVLPGMQAAFVDIGLEKAAFLYVDDVYTHREIWEAEEGEPQITPAQRIMHEVGREGGPAHSEGSESADASDTGAGEAQYAQDAQEAQETSEGGESPERSGSFEAAEMGADPQSESDLERGPDLGEEEDHGTEDFDSDEEVEEDEEELDEGPESETFAPTESSAEAVETPAPTVIAPRVFAPILPPEVESFAPVVVPPPAEGGEVSSAVAAAPGAEGAVVPASENKIEFARDNRRGRHRRGRRGGRNRNRRPGGEKQGQKFPGETSGEDESLSSVQGIEGESGEVGSDRAGLDASSGADEGGDQAGRQAIRQARKGFNEQRSRDRRIKPKASHTPERGQAKIEDLLKEGQEVIVQVAKDAIATKGARLTCHLSLPGRHLVCMPTIDHVGVSRRIERDDERRRLRDFVEKNRPNKNLGFIVRTAAGQRAQAEKRVKQDIDYLSELWEEIREKANNSSAPSLIYEDLNSILRSIRDWVTEDIDRIVVDSRYHYNEILRFVSKFMPSLKHKIDLYHGDIPVFDAYKVSSELSRSLERKVWLKSGGYIVIDQAEALVAIDVNTGRYVGKKNLEDTILKTNLEAVEEVAYQLRLRNCGGIIIIDFIDMEKDENKMRVYRALEEALKKDRARPSIMRISELGLVEMTRKRTRDTLVRSLCESCSHCEGKGFVKSKHTIAYDILREIEREGIERDVSKILIQAHPDVIDILAIDERDAVDQLERRYKKQVYLQAVGDYHTEQFEVIADKKQRDRENPQPMENREWALRGGNNNWNTRGSSGGGSSGGGGNGRRHGKNRSNQDEEGVAQSAPAPIIKPRATPLIVPTEPAPADQSISPPAISAGVDAPSSEGGGEIKATPSLSDDFSEEDRLAFVRAQAAQDAALAQMGAAGGTAAPAQEKRPGKGRNDRGGRFSKFKGKKFWGRGSKAAAENPSTEPGAAVVEPPASGGGTGDGGEST